MDHQGSRGEIDGRTRHYGAFYGLDEPEGDGPVVLVLGNCQAESLRVMLDAPDVRAVRMPPVHELVAADLPHLDRWLGRTDLLVSQPVRSGYHGLPLGTGEVATRLPSGSTLVVVPVLRFAGLYPTHAIVRPPQDPSLSPPIVAYHDLRLLAEASGASLPDLRGRTVRQIADLSLAQLTRRESAFDTLVLSDLFDRPRFSLMRTLNHPGNEVWTEAAARVRERAGLAPVLVDPGRELLDSVHAPREDVVIETWGLDDAATAAWLVDGEIVEAGAVRDAHLRWYSQNRDVVEAGMDRHVDALRLLAA